MVTTILSFLAWFVFWIGLEFFSPKVKFWVYSFFSAASLFFLTISILDLIIPKFGILWWQGLVFAFGFPYFGYKANRERNKYKPTLLNRKLKEEQDANDEIR